MLTAAQVAPSAAAEGAPAAAGYAPAAVGATFPVSETVGAWPTATDHATQVAVSVTPDGGRGTFGSRQRW